MNDGDDNELRGKGNRRSMFGVVIAAGSIAGACVAISVVSGLVIDHLPFAKADEFQTFKKETVVGISQLKGSVSNIDLNMKESLELQLLDRVQKLDDRMAKMPPGADDLSDMRTIRREANQRLEAVRDEIRLMRSVP